MQAPLLRRINQLPSVVSPKTALSGAYLALDVPLGPVPGAYRTMRGTPEQLAEYLGQLAADNSLPSLRKSVEFRTKAERTASGYGPADASTMEELDPLSMALGTEIFVYNDPSGQREYIVVYDGAGPLLVWVDGNFAQSPRGKIPAKIVANTRGGTGGRTLSAVTLNVDTTLGNKYRLNPDLMDVVAALIAAGKKPVWIIPDAGSAARTTIYAKNFNVLPANTAAANAAGVDAMRTNLLGQ